MEDASPGRLSRRIGIEMASSTRSWIRSRRQSSSPACAMPLTGARSTSFSLRPAPRWRLMACAADARKRASRGLNQAGSLTCSRWPGRSSRTSRPCVPPVHLPQRQTRRLRRSRGPRQHRADGCAGICRGRRSKTSFVLPCRYFLTAASTTDLSCARPFSISRPIIRSMFMNRQSALATKLLRPAMLQVTAV